MGLDKLITDIILKSAVESTGTDIAWYASVYSELNTGTWNQMNDADVRQAQEASNLLDNSWNSLYDVMNICQRVLERTAPGAADEDAALVRAIALTMMAYNLAITTDGWGEVPFTEALKEIFFCICTLIFSRLMMAGITAHTSIIPPICHECHTFCVHHLLLRKL